MFSSFLWIGSFLLLSCHLCESYQLHHHAKLRNEFRFRLQKSTGSEGDGKPKLTFGKLVQLITMGAGAPMLGEVKEIDKDGKMIFELEANNLVDSEGNSIQTKAKYFRDGYVEEKSDMSPPGFWGNLVSGGRLQGEWEAKILAKKDDPR
jgi:hypothetical protein